MAQDCIVIDTPDKIDAYVLLARKGAAKLETLGMRHSSGRSVIADIKREYGFKGSKLSVYDQYCAKLREMGVIKD